MKHLLYILFATVILTSCQKPDTESTKPLQKPQELRFCTYLEEGGEIRPITRSVDGDLSSGYYLSGLLSTSNYPAAANYDRLMWNVGMNKNGTYKSPAEKKYFWAEGNTALRHNFIAYSVPTGSSTATSLSGGTTSQPLLSLVYTNVDNPLQQTDLLYSDNSSNLLLSKYAPVVKLIFKHRMARVMFKAICINGVPLTECEAIINYKPNTIRKAGTVSLGDNAPISFSNSYHSGSYYIKRAFTLPGSAIDASTAIEVGDLILLPKQSLAEGWATLTFRYKPDGAIAVESATMDLPAINLTSAAGQQYNILINIYVQSQNISVGSVTLTNWTAKSTTIDKLR